MLGVGIDIIEIARIRKVIEKYSDRFLQKIFSPREKNDCIEKGASIFASLAGRFCAKEAVAKALGVGIGAKLWWTDIEVLASGSGAPILSLSSKASDRFSDPEIVLSISHCREYATAIAILKSFGNGS